MQKFFGLKLCPDHIGWAVIGTNEEGNRSVIDRGVLSFNKVYVDNAGKEKSVAADRSQARLARRGRYRLRERKVRLLRVLCSAGFAPSIPEAQLDGWLKHKLFPEDPAFREWFLTDDKAGKNPYSDRHECLTRKLDLQHSERDRYTLGRAFYHINQRRGFLSNRLDQSSANEGGEVWTGINELDKAMADAGCEYLGEYFYQLYGNEPIRRRYTERERHYEKEFRAICEKQQLPEELVDEIYREIFFQRQIVQPKKLVGRCKFEKDKTRCPVTRPEFEEFRALSFINNIRVARPGETDMSPLTEEERMTVLPKFYRKSKPGFKFSELAVALAGKKAEIFYSGEEREDLKSWQFNYRGDTTVSGCPVTAALRDIFGEDWIAGIRSRYALVKRKDGEKSDLEITNDVWHVLYTFTKDSKVIAWAETNLGLEGKEAEALTKIKMEKKYGNLSLKAICRILPYLREGMRYDQATMFANADKVFSPEVRRDEGLLKEGLAIIRDVTLNYTPSSDINDDSKVGKMQADLWNAGFFDVNLDRLYHPSMIEVFPKVKADKNGRKFLGSPRTDSLRNPAVENTEFRLRRLVNSLMKEGTIDSGTRVSIMLSRNLNDKNMRKAISLYQKGLEEKREEYKAAIEEFFGECGLNRVPSEDDILKYTLWEEQNHLDLYTGNEIKISDFLGSEASYDIEHTFPRSRGGDDSLENKTLCNWRFNRHVKGSMIPSELDNHDEIMAVIDSLDWKERIEKLRQDIERQKKNSRVAALPEDKDRAVVRRHLDELELRYLQGKLWRFTAGGVPEKLSRRLDVDVAYIAKYAKAYLESVFDDVFIEKRETVVSFRQMWGLPSFRNERNMISYGESCVDAAVIACVTGKEYAQWTRYKADYDRYLFEDGRKPNPVLKPWPTFTEDMRELADGVLSCYCHGNNLFKKTSKKARRKNGKILKGKDGKPFFAKGDAVRGSLNRESFYGAIERDGEIRYVIRKPLSSLDEKDIENIVDEGLRGCIKGIVAEHGLDGLKENADVSWDGYARPRAVRIFCPRVKGAMSLKKQTYTSKHDYKRDYHVMNDGNYAMAVYEGMDEDGVTRARVTTLSNLEAVRRRRNYPGQPLFPKMDDGGFRLKYVFRIGQLVLFYEDAPGELYKCTELDLSRRLHRITGISQQDGRGTVTFVHHLEARSAKDLGKKQCAWSSGNEYCGRFTVRDAYIKVLVEGRDFRIDTTGKIEFFKH